MSALMDDLRAVLTDVKRPIPSSYLAGYEDMSERHAHCYRFISNYGASLLSLLEAGKAMREELCCSGTDSAALWRPECDCESCEAARAYDESANLLLRTEEAKGGRQG